VRPSWLCLLGAAASATLLAASPAPAELAMPSGAIIFLSGRSVADSVVLHATDARGGLKDLGLRAIEAHWSPDGRRIAFSRYVSASTGKALFDFYVTRTGGASMRRVVRAPSLGGQLTWSPDGRRIAFVEDIGGRTALSVIGIDGRGRRRLTWPGEATDRQPAWSPDGKSIAFVRDGEDCARSNAACGRLDAVSSDGNRLRRLPTGSTDAVIGRPSWSPDGKRLAFALCCDGGARVVNADGTGLRTIVPSGTNYVSWSPNGKWIALAGYGALYVVRPDGRSYRKIADIGASAPSWSPDSRAVAVEGRCCSPDVFAVAIDGSRMRRLTEGWRYGYGNYAPEWNPRGRPLAQVRGAAVSPENPTDSVSSTDVLRATRPVERLAADGSRVAVAYSGGKVEAWDPLARSIVRFGLRYSVGWGHGFGLAGDRVATTSVSPAMGIDSWFVGWASVRIPAGASTGTTFAGWPGPCCSTPLEHVAGDGSLLVVDGWGPCRISQSPPCASEPKFNGRIYRVTESGAVVPVVSDAGPLTLLSVDRDRIAVDRENGTLQLFRGDGTPLIAVTYGPARLLGAALAGADLVVLTTDGLADYDSSTGELRHLRAVPSGARLADAAAGLAVYLVGTEIHVLRLADGREIIIRPPTQGPVLAQLEESGLFYSYVADDPRYPGRVTFVPLAMLLERMVGSRT
jgi:Tol biopolymer transport system component